MKTLETDDPIKSQLLQKATHQREELADDVKALSERTETMLTNALIVGGALMLGYLIVKGLSGRKSRRKRKAKATHKIMQAAPASDDSEEVPYESSPSVVGSMMSQIGSAIATQATVILLDLAKEKLAEFLQAQAEKKANESAS
jgi:hypothetical protein